MVGVEWLIGIDDVVLLVDIVWLVGVMFGYMMVVRKCVVDEYGI